MDGDSVNYNGIYHIDNENNLRRSAMRNKRIFVMIAALSLIIAVLMSETVFAGTTRYTCFKSGCSNYCVSGCYYCHSHKCTASGCPYGKTSGSSYCSSHKEKQSGSYTKKSGSNNKETSSSSRKYSKTKKKSSYSDTYDVHSYKDATSFADDKCEEFYDYEDDYDDEDEAWDDAADYWYDNY